MSSPPVGGNIIGIELGVTHSYAGHLSNSGEPVLLRNREGELSTRSAIWFEDSGKVVVGTEAWKMRGIALHVFCEFLRDIGQGITYPTPDGQFSPSDFCALLLKQLSTELTENHGDIDALAITVPANFTDCSRQDVRRAAVMAGLRDFRLIDTATAVALTLHHQHDLKNGRYLTLSLGNGSTDALAFEVLGNDVRILSSSGIALLGFSDFKEKFVGLINQKYAHVTGIKSSDQDMLTRCQLTRFDLEEGMKSLGFRQKVSIPLKTDQGCFRCEISREEFAEAIRPLTEQIELLVESVFDSADISTGQLTKSFLQAEPEIYAHLAHIVKSLTGANPLDMPEGSAALGATIYAAFSAGNKRLTGAQRIGVGLMLIQDLAPSFLGTIEIDGLTGKRRNRVIIHKGEPLPAYRSYGLTADDSGRLPAITLTESGSEQEDPDFVSYIRTLAASRARPGSRHTLTIGFDENGCAYVTLVSRDDGEDGEASGFMELPPRRS
jgi:molecular chaperone DnaK (HSP70)